MTDKLMRVRPQAPEFGRGVPRDPMERLAYFAHLAPSTHNSQPWRFVVEGDAIDVFADPARALPAADRDRREMYLSVGCALETLLIAADYEGLGVRLAYFPVAADASYVCRVEIMPQGEKRPNSAADLLHAVPRRHTSHRPFDASRPLAQRDLGLMARAVDGNEVAIHFLDAAAHGELEQLLESAERTLFADPGYREELGRWVGEGALGTTWLISKLGQFAVTQLPLARQVAQTEATWLKSAPVVALLSSRDDRRLFQVRAGQAYVRIALIGESREIRNQPFSAPLELPETRAALGDLFGIGARAPQHVFRLGYAEPEQARTARRPLGEVMLRSPARAGDTASAS
ncbi:MAG TPA: hypothetical protein VG591_00400 [Burkholderiales bacterium]|jgi:hypothetical protein|nr:hypothetical protein [Burkholderiales bacterium]